MLRAAFYPLRLVAARLGRRNGPALVVVIGIAAGAAVVFGGRTLTTVAQDRAVSQAIERIPDGSRSVRAVWFGLPGSGDEPQPVLERRARRALASAGAGNATSLVLFRETTIAGSFAGLGGVEQLGRWVTLRSGRLPRLCTASRCEVLRLRGSGRLPQPAGLRLVEVGTAAIDNRILFGDFLAPTDNALEDAEVSPAVAAAAGYHRPPPPPLFLANGVGALAGAPALDTLYRSYAWVSPLEPGRPRLWEIDRLASGVTRARSQLQAVSTSFDLIAPVEELRAAQSASRAAGRRLGLVAGEAAALLFAFAILAALTLRRDLLAARRRLAWFGARGWQLALLTAAETGALALAGTVIGFGVGVVGGAAVARKAGAPAGAVLGQSILSARGLVLAVLVAVATGAVLAAAVAVRPPRLGRMPFSPLDAAALAAIVLVAYGLIRGDANGDLVLLLPGLVTFAAAVLVARMLRPTLRLAERLARRRSLGLRLASLSLARNPGYAIVATAFLVVSFALALFAESYRATLARGERDQAAHRVPLDFVLQEDLRRLIPVLDAAPLERFRALPAVEVEPVLRLRGGVGRLEGESGITMLGLPPSSLPQLNGWRADERGTSPKELALRIAAAPSRNGPRLPPGLNELRVQATGGNAIRLAAEIEGRAGRFVRLELGGTSTLTAAIPPEARGGRLAGIVIEPATRLQERGADAGQAATGVVGLSFPNLPEALDGWVGFGGARLDGNTVRYTLTPASTTRIRPRQPVDNQPVPVLATPRLAAAADAGGLLPLQIAGERLSVRVVGTVRRMPGVDGQAIVGDTEALGSAIDLQRPGAGRVNEIWLRLRDPARAGEIERRLAAKPFHVLQTTLAARARSGGAQGSDRARHTARPRRSRRGRPGTRARRDSAHGAGRSARRARGALRSRGARCFAWAASAHRPAACAGGGCCRTRRRSAGGARARWCRH